MAPKNPLASKYNFHRIFYLGNKGKLQVTNEQEIENSSLLDLSIRFELCQKGEGLSNYVFHSYLQLDVKSFKSFLYDAFHLYYHLHCSSLSNIQYNLFFVNLNPRSYLRPYQNLPNP